MTHYGRSGDDIDRGLVGYWKLDDLKSGGSVAIDRTNFNDGTITGATNADGVNGLNADAMSFDGVDDFVDIVTGNPLVPQNSNLTLSAWVKPALTQGTRRILVKAYGATHDNRAGSINFGNTNNFTFVYPTSSLLTDNLDGDVITEERWYHVVGVFSNTEGFAKIYVDGILENEISLTPNITTPTGTSHFFFGTEQNTGTPNYFDGSIALARIYNRVLTSGEVSKLHRLKL